MSNNKRDINYELSTFVFRMKNLLLTITVLAFNCLMALPIQPLKNSYIVSFNQSQNTESLHQVCGRYFESITALNNENSIFLFKNCSDRWSKLEVESVLKALNEVQFVQEDSKVTFRSTTPNDTFYSNQWHLPLIKANLAWDSTVSGVNKRGDTIVIAVVDDGLHINHPDFQGNIWINYADVLGNGIDDDGNGYIDDTYGWNFQSTNNDISDSDYYAAKHGTPVAAIIGARGNNLTGVTGIMWNVKLMIVNVADTGNYPNPFQSDVIKAYSYLLHQRKLYNSSNGSKGAFVVAENSSFGIDNGTPTQSPLWCSFYDTLGKYGILSVSSVANSQKNPEDQGDMPTLCPSNDLITVGGSTGGDNYGGSAYSSISVDLSAPGYNVFSSSAYTKLNIQTGNLYKSGFSGTSFSAPMVTATVGLLHAYACDRLLDSIKNNPRYGNYIIKRAIMEGVDEVPALVGKNVTNGRLNILGAIQVIQKFCDNELSVAQIEIPAKTVIFPNPGNDRLCIVSDKTILNVTCWDINGRQMNCLFEDGVLNTSALNSGVYFIQIKTESGIEVKKYTVAL
jgi:serine protease